MTQVLDGRYELGERIGRGGAARVHRAVDQRLGRQVAVKVLDDQAAAQADPAGRDRFLHEAQTAAQLRHPHVVTVFDAGESDGELFLVMELVEGVTLSELIAARAPLPTAEAAKVAVQILSALQAAHDLNIVHRDVKPANVIIDANGDAHLTDFGIARRLDDLSAHLTSAGTVMGTPTYLAPEQATGGTLGVTTDVYLVGLVLDEMLTGRRARSYPPSRETATRLAAAAGAFDPRDVVADTDQTVAAVVVRATDPDPERRFASAAAMAVALGAATRVDGLTTGLGALALAMGDGATQPLPDPVPGTAALELAAPSLSGTTTSGALDAGAATVAMAPSPPLRAERRPSRWGWLPFVVAAIMLLVVGVVAGADGGDLPEDPVATDPVSSLPPTTAAPADDDDVTSAPSGNDRVRKNGKGNDRRRGGEDDD